MAKNYHPQDIEPKWQRAWEKKLLYRAADFAKKKKFYALVEFPYPTGEGLHMGHAFTNTILDVFVRKKRMSGFNILHPMGWDSFGLPTENYAIKTDIHPTIITKRNTKRFREQNERLAISYNWDREIDTTDPKYYRWTQWIFVQLFKHGLAYKAERPVGWCPSCKIILANEEIVAGNCERCGHEAKRRMQKQWLLEITKYADRLTDELDLVDYPDYVKASQKTWIGRKEGITINYPVTGSKLKISCFTTRPDTNFGATFVVVAPEHKDVLKLTTEKYQKKVRDYIEKAKTKSELERISEGRVKTGIFTGNCAINHLNGKKMPIYVSDFVLASVGTGAVVGVPGHDKRDFEFAQKFKLPVIRVVVGPNSNTFPITKIEQVQEEEGTMVNSEFLDGMDIHEATKKMIDYMVKKGWAKRTVSYHLRDWIFSRQHYWGEPIPMIFCPACRKQGIIWWDTKEGKGFLKKNKLIGKASQKGDLTGWHPVTEKSLPVELPKVEKYQPTDTGESPLANIKSWVKVKCPVCGKEAKRETDTMPNWAGSSWYFLRFCDPKNNNSLADMKKLKYWIPVDLYLGGPEHTTLHLLYSRFWHKFLNDIGIAPSKEPYAARRQHGVILAEDGYRMSKSRGNVVNPEDVVEKFGADTLRVYLMFMGPYEATMSWSTKGVGGSYRFLARVWRIYHQKKINSKTDLRLLRELHRLIKRVGEDIEALKHNTAIAALMEFLNSWSQKGSLSKKDAGIFLQLLAPFAPHISEEIWCEVLRNEFSVHQQEWPKYDPKLIEEEKVTIVIQVNGKLRGQVEVGSKESGDRRKVEKLAKKEKNVAKYLRKKKIKKVVFVPGKLINFVI